LTKLLEGDLEPSHILGDGRELGAAPADKILERQIGRDLRLDLGDARVKEDIRGDLVDVKVVIPVDVEGVAAAAAQVEHLQTERGGDIPMEQNRGISVLFSWTVRGGQFLDECALIADKGEVRPEGEGVGQPRPVHAAGGDPNPHPRFPGGAGSRCVAGIDGQPLVEQGAVEVGDQQFRHSQGIVADGWSSQRPGLVPVIWGILNSLPIRSRRPFRPTHRTVYRAPDEVPQPDPASAVSFSELGISASMLRTLDEVGYTDPTPIQALALPVALSGRDLIGQARTGSGKTAAFAVPILERLDSNSSDVQALILCPTRELAAQVTAEFEKLAQNRQVQILAVVGGDPIRRQLDGLSAHAAVVVGTPGRVLDHLQRRTLSLRGVRFAVLDEADRMLDMGFAPDVEKILLQTAKERQTMLFSATVPEWVHRLAARHMRNPETISVSGRTELVPTVRQWCIECSWSEKEEALGMLMDSPVVTSGLIFTNTKRNADHLHTALLGRGYDVTVIHGDLSQRERDQALQRFRGSKVRFLIATDVAARGLDIDDISHVINYDIPATPEDYVHRVGRTARAGRDGVALTLITPIEILKIRDIERHTKRPIEHHTLEDLKQLAGTAGALVS
jgi:ATP-dependent RNA helicase DeaD